MRILIGCEFSGVVRNAFRNRGHDAWSCDWLPSADNSAFHIQGDVRNILNDSWDMAIFHPPSTRIANSGVRWLHERDLWEEMRYGATFFKELWNAPIHRIAIENPIPHKYAIEIIGSKYTQIIHPWQFGHGETKATCLWLKNLPKLKPTSIVSGREQRIWKLPRTKDRGQLRSITYSGIADAMASQWG